MSLSTYTGLKAALADLLNRTDLTSQIPDFIALFEAKANRVLDVRQMVTLNDAFSISTETVSVPADFKGVKSFRLATSPVKKLQYRKPDEFDDILDDASYAPGAPLYYTVVGSTFVFSPVPDATYTARLRYRQTIPPLASNASNWLLTAHPDAYLYGSALQSAPYLKADERLATWDVLLSKAFQEIESNDAVETVGSEPTMKARTFG